MRLRTIWSLRDMSTLERLRRSVDWSAMEIGRHLPKRIRYWTTMQEIARATRSNTHIMGMTLDEVLQNLDAPKDLS